MKTLARLILIILFGLQAAFAQDIKYTVEKVVDGDTVIIEGGQEVRLIGIDAPELDYTPRPVIHFAEAAYLFAKNMLEGKIVRIEYDENNTDKNHKDKYGRTLAYLYLADGTFFNAEIVKQGYAFAYTRFPFKYLDDFKKYQREAMEDQRGLWKEALYNPEARKLIMSYKKLDDESKMLFKESFQRKEVR